MNDPFETTTILDLPEEDFEKGDSDLPNSEILETSVSNFSEIAFPNLRSVRFHKDKETVRFSVNYEKLKSQLENYFANSNDD